MRKDDVNLFPLPEPPRPADRHPWLALILLFGVVGLVVVVYLLAPPVRS